MPYTISEETKDRTNCRNHFHCLSGSMKNVCDVFTSLGENLIVTACPKRGWNCDHCKALHGPEGFGFCSCPTRIELYNRYSV